MDTMLSFHTDNLSNAMTKEQIKAVCPLAFYDEPTNPGVSNKYMMANTETIIDDMARLGWYPVEAKQCRAKKGSSGIRSLHLVAFQNPEIYTVDENGNPDCYYRIILLNSHDGFNSFVFRVGLIRLCCSNGLCIGANMMAEISIRHINYTFEQLRTVMNDTISKVPYVTDAMNSMKSVILNDEQKSAMAKEVIRIKRDVSAEEEIEAPEDVVADVLSPVRDEDKGNDLWTVFNVCQEKLMKGLFSMPDKNNKPRKQRRIVSFKKDINYNQRLWDYAYSFVEKVA